MDHPQTCEFASSGLDGGSRRELATIHAGSLVPPPIATTSVTFYCVNRSPVSCNQANSGSASGAPAPPIRPAYPSSTASTGGGACPSCERCHSCARTGQTFWCCSGGAPQRCIPTSSLPSSRGSLG